MLYLRTIFLQTSPYVLDSISFRLSHTFKTVQKIAFLIEEKFKSRISNKPQKVSNFQANILQGRTEKKNNGNKILNANKRLSLIVPNPSGEQGNCTT